MSFSQMHNDHLDPDRHLYADDAAAEAAAAAAADLCGQIPFAPLLEYLARLCDREIQACGLNTKAGMKAATAKALLTAAIEELETPNGTAKAPAPTNDVDAWLDGKIKGAQARHKARQQKPKSPPP